MVDATLIQASGSTKNKARQRDPEMRSTRKGGQYYFGMKVHIGADVNSGAAHEVAVTAANESDMGPLPNLLRADDTVRQAHRPRRCLGMRVMPVTAISTGRGRWDWGGM